jgi:nitrogen fixation protein
MVKRPRDCARYIRDKIQRKSPIQQGIPWISWAAYDYLRRHVKPGSRVFEWGGGGSTIFFSKMGCDVTTVESSAEWISQIKTALGESATRVALRHVPSETKDPSAIRQYIVAVADGGPWDIILVDGLEEPYLGRLACVKMIGSHIRAGGMIILDDSWRDEYKEVPDVLSHCTRLIFKGLGPARPGVTQTDIYLVPPQQP